ncbi:hypothetical protein AVEN_261342-1 [Araneus ventricosus]|uniref:Uncharacterized protein n=1 Tax=Araneus ventricosus TaxID=182803 RepID=A0A4Y2W585_ARAVE|nr:hypothetical protein AVEN_5354-1 [Araneus ventricosus]GBO32023.1 hypothetical protein AVEN_261342-1 [Araneus ventricosus]
MVMTPHHLTQAFPRAPEPHCEVGRISSLGALARPGLKLQFSKGAPVPLIKSLFRGAMPPLGVEVGRFESGVKAPLLRVSTLATKLKGVVREGAAPNDKQEGRQKIILGQGWCDFK